MNVRPAARGALGRGGRSSSRARCTRSTRCSKVGQQIAEPILLHDRRPAPRLGRQAGRRAARAGRPAGPAGVVLPAPALRRSEAARHDRDGAGLPAAPAHRRRAHHGAGRDGAGPGARPARLAWSATSGVGLVVISHDLSVLGTTCDRVAVMYAGRVVEEGPAGEVLDARRATPTRGRLSAAFPTIGDQAARFAPHGLPGDPPWPGDLPTGCPFHPRCPEADRPCAAPRTSGCATGRRRPGVPPASRSAIRAGSPGDGPRPAGPRGRVGCSRSRSAPAAAGVARAVDGVDLAIGARGDRRAGR